MHSNLTRRQGGQENRQRHRNSELLHSGETIGEPQIHDEGG